ncbi:MAG: AAA family ATPase [Planctomycetota bacterium]|nr:MAG: AAA family ATPase [Planctomycetota bacterium]
MKGGRNLADTTITSEQFKEKFDEVKAELSKVFIGHDVAVTNMLISIYSRGHVLLSGMPGLGRSLLVQTIAKILGLDFNRLQFTPDLLPTDITGAELLVGDGKNEERRFEFFKGPVFANIVLADEINRSPARTQSALLEVMQEKQVTMGGQRYKLPNPFLLIATQNSLDTEGVWPLGEAQADRFMFSIEQGYPHYEEERKIILATTGTLNPSVSAISNPAEVIAMQDIASNVPIVPSVKEFALRLVRASRPGEEGVSDEINKIIKLGAGPRASQALLTTSKVKALSCGRSYVCKQDIIDVAEPVMAHRLQLDFRAKADGKDYKYVLGELFKSAQEKDRPQVNMWAKELLK